MRRRRGFVRRLTAREHWEMHYGPNMTPMVDVVMVILVFFMASTAVMGPEWMLRTALPVRRAVATPADPSREEVRLDVSVRVVPGGRVVIDGAGIEGGDARSLAEAIEQVVRRVGPENVTLLVTPEADVPYDDLVRIHEVCHALKVTKIGLLEAGASSGEPSPKPAAVPMPTPPGR